MANADRISEVYKGEIWGAALQQRARDRIDWLVSQARGAVLDVGCSQGIATLLAARTVGAGVRVVGVDNELDRLAYAMADRGREPDGVADRVGFVGASGGALPFADDCFDTVLLGEVLEHLDKPDDVLAEVARVLRPDGMVAITVPFGLSPHHDHRRTFYAANLLELVASHLAPTSIELVDRYLRCTAAADAHAPRLADLLAAVQPAADAQVLAVERAELAAREQIGELSTRTRELARRARQLASHEREITRLRTMLGRAQARVAASGDRQRELAFQRDRWRWQYASLSNRRVIRALVAVRHAARSPRRLVGLPLALARVAFGPAPSTPPRPQRHSTGGGDRSPQAAPEQRRDLELRMKMLAPSPPVTLRDLRVAAVLDTFSESSFGSECELITFRPDNWEAVLTRQPPHLLFVESAWKATGGAWQYQVGTYSHAESVGLPHLRALVEWCRARQIPTVFWNKEDPVHFGKFTQAAQLFDVVLTTDADCIDRYRALPHLRARTVAALPFAAQPALHHPVALQPREAVPAFGGTYYRNRHPQRRAQLEMLLDAARPSGLVIFDRTFGEQSDGVGFPERFAPHIRGGLAYDEMVATYRRYRVFLNANSVTTSPTMFSRRVFELLACGTPVVSTPSAGMTQLFGDVVEAVDTAGAARSAVERLLADERVWEARSAAGLRRVHGQHTAAHRLSTLADHSGYAIAPYGDERIAVLTLGDDVTVDSLDTIVSQSERPHELLVGTTGGVATPDDVTAVVQSAGRPRSERLAQLAATTDAPWVFVADAERTYGLDHLADLAVARRWTSADVIGAGADTDRLDGPLAHRHVRRVAPHGVLLRRDLVAEHGWDDRDGAAIQARLTALGATFYAVRA
ncbi:MAG: methyltransferase domain-containing protein [Actinobacteria bacterium]|nr:methyltransferase domain-containing protein [Actinomycetota bacterium]